MHGEYAPVIVFGLTRPGIELKSTFSVAELYPVHH